MARWSRRIRPVLGESRSAARATTIAMVTGARASVSQKRRVSVRPRVNIAIMETERIKNQMEAGMRFSNAAMRLSWISMVPVSELT